MIRLQITDYRLRIYFGAKRLIVVCLLSSVFCLLFAGCTLTPSRPDKEPELAADRDASFMAEGRFSSRLNDQATTAVFVWHHAPEVDSISLSSPLGAQLAQIDRVGTQLTLKRGEYDAETIDDPNWAVRLQRAVGFPLPVDGLAFWIRAVPQPGAPAQLTHDEQQRVTQLQQQGWQIRYRYPADAARLPDFVDARYGEALSLKVKIDQWESR